MSGIDPSVWFAAGYGIALLLIAHLLDKLARRTAQRTVEWRSGGFRYHAGHDAWVCPEDQWLWPDSFDPDNRVMRYRASPTVCNACPVKESCTTSGNGRQISRNVDPWPSSEAERFHRGIACAVVVLGLLWPLVTMITNHTAAELTVLTAVTLAIAAGSWPLWSHLHRSPAGFPDHVRIEALDDTIARQAAGTSSAARRRATYQSDLRPGPSAAHPGARGREQAENPEHDRFATRWGSFEENAGDQEPLSGWSRRKNK
ncbi:hypothetical protein [Paenarthrobacter sp. PH39-S1]|uniref:hypothetical protein n=1 Tax=Paenarthrobacter sp. PH39-S1 TaxID=3046204 RepID=UPI0024BA9738|nr:hypothetical protein [Paenarthrobacter sp. PH39-S1]MDJ0358234.1 hypothetical protein [Paenarthrobacter sp. PH39-S1]